MKMEARERNVVKVAGAILLFTLPALVSLPAFAEPNKTDSSRAPSAQFGDRSPMFYTPNIPPGGGSAKKTVPQSEKSPRDEAMKTPEMSFYIARGDADACGPGCSEWIVGDGRFVFGTIDKFRAVLRKAGNRKLPVFFNSPGGEVRAATALGRLLRQRGMTAGVGRTAPSICGGASEEACAAFKRKSEEALHARLSGFGGQCNSACVYSLIGAKTREVPPNAVVGVHAVALTLEVKVLRGPVPSKAKLNAMAKSRLNDVNENLRGYVEEMGIDPELFDISVKVSPNKVRVLTRDEIARFGIDTRKSIESSWSIVGGAQPVLMKTIAEAKTSPGRKYRSSMIVFTCDRGAGRTLIHGREPDSGEDSAIQINAVYGSHNFAFPVNGRTMKIGEMFYVTRSAPVPRDFFKVAEADASFNIMEAADSTQLVRKYSVPDLNKSLDDLEQTCARSTSAQAN